MDKSVAFHVKFLHDLTCQKPLKRIIFDRVIQEIKGGRFFWGGHGVNPKIYSFSGFTESYFFASSLSSISFFSFAFLFPLDIHMFTDF